MADDTSGKTVKLFKFIRKTFQFIGFHALASNQSHRINSKIWINIFCLAQFLFSTTAFLLFDANSMMEYGMEFFTCITLIATMILYLTLVWQMGNILNYIENCEQFIGKSEFKPRIH